MPRLGRPAVRPRHARPRRERRSERFSAEVCATNTKDQRKYWLFQYALTTVQLASAIAAWIG